jgi:hypothetical protein
LAQWVIGGDFDEDDPDAVGVLDPHLSQSPGLGYRFTQNANADRSQPLMSALISRTWSQIITECPAARAAARARHRAAEPMTTEELLGCLSSLPDPLAGRG